jgi:pimeloyl-ACP methyl ester carboxylesterase
VEKFCATPKLALVNSVEAYIEADGLKTFYVKAGSGFPVVMIHGAAPGASAQVNWQLNIEPLAAAGFTVYAYDQPGFGKSENPADLSIEYRVTHAKALINALKLDRYHVIGNSVGGYVAARLALEDGRVGKFVTTTSGTLAPKGSAESQALGQKHSEELREYVPSLENMRALTLGTLHRKELVTEALVRARYEMSIGKNQEAAQNRRGVKPPRSLTEDLPNLNIKTLLLWGNQDRGVSVERGLLLFQLIPNAEFHLFDQCAHWVQWDQADRFNRLVADFLAGGD